MNKIHFLMAALFLAVGSPTFAAGDVPAALPKVNKSSPGGGPSDATVKYLIQSWLDTSSKRSDGDSFARISSWDSDIRRGKKTKHRYYGIGEKEVFPVKVDFTALEIHKTRTQTVHWTGGLYNFYQDDFGEGCSHLMSAHKRRMSR